MCTKPIEIDGQELACRVCDECVAMRLNDWVARACAEADVSEHTMALTLTYNDDDPKNLISSSVFVYADIRRFLAGLRRQIKYHYKVTGALRFLVAGEIGKDNERVHWHMVIFSNVDLIPLGKWVAPWGEVSKHKDIITPVGVKEGRNRSWSLWPHGFIVVQEPDANGIRYVLKYAMKDQFHTLKAKGQGRENHASIFQTGYFRMSTRPAIGMPYVERLVSRLREKYRVLPKLELQVPMLKWWWYPRATIRTYLLEQMRAIKDERLEALGTYPPQWSSLISNARNNERDLEILIGEEISDEEAKEDEFEYWRIKDVDRRERAKDHYQRAVRKKCGHLFPCADCAAAASRTDLENFAGGWRRTKEDGCFSNRYLGIINWEKERAKATAPAKEPSPLCILKDAKSRSDAFFRKA